MAHFARQALGGPRPDGAALVDRPCLAVIIATSHLIEIFSHSQGEMMPSVVPLRVFINQSARFTSTLPFNVRVLII
jgi:hypothetical protein